MNRNTDFIPFARPCLGTAEEEAVLRILRSGWLTTGAETACFEKEMAEKVGSTYALALNSATAGLHLGLEALGIGPGDRVLTTPYTFTASAEVIRYLDADPLFVDVESDTLNINPELASAAVRRNTIKALLPVHIGGLYIDIGDLKARCSGLPVIEDAAHAFPVRTPAGYAGTTGEAGVFSFYANKTITTGEGGMLVTDDPAIAKRVKLMRLHGIDREAWNRYTDSPSAWEYAIEEAGYKYNMTDIAAAIGRVQLQKAERFLARRTAIAASYNAGFRDCDYLRLPVSVPGHAWHLYLIRLNLNRLSIDRKTFINQLTEAGIGTSVHYIPLHIMPYYRRRYGLKPEDFPVSLKAYREVISLPIYPDLSDENLDRIIMAIRRIGDKSVKIRSYGS